MSAWKRTLSTNIALAIPFFGLVLIATAIYNKDLPLWVSIMEGIEGVLFIPFGFMAYAMNLTQEIHVQENTDENAPAR